MGAVFCLKFLVLVGEKTLARVRDHPMRAWPVVYEAEGVFFLKGSAFPFPTSNSLCQQGFIGRGSVLFQHREEMGPHTGHCRDWRGNEDA